MKIMEFFLRPHIIVVTTAALSLFAWLFLNYGNFYKGFVEPINFSTVAILVALTWFASIIVFSLVGLKIGASLFKEYQYFNITSNINSYGVYSKISIISLLGVLYVVYVIVSNLGLSGIVQAIQQGQGNTFKEVIYEDYSIGLFSLRYASILAGALALYHALFKRFILLNVINILSLLAVSFISSRLSLICAIVIFLSVIAINRTSIKLRPISVLLCLTILFHLLCVLNYVRNINTYRMYGIDGFYAAGFNEILVYLGTPFQGFLAASTNYTNLSGAPLSAVYSYTTISESLTTNSAFLSLVNSTDLLSVIIIMCATSLIGGMILALAKKNKNNSLILLYGVIIYCFAELWRLYLFNFGIIYTLIAIIIFTTFAGYIIDRSVRMRKMKIIG